MREPDKLYEFQYTSFAIPPSLYSFECYHHLEMMRESYAFVFYFVVTDSLFYLIPAAVSAFSIVRFLQKLQKSLDFQNRMIAGNGGGGGGGSGREGGGGEGGGAGGGIGSDAAGKKKKKSLWTLSRSVFALDALAFLLTLLTLICFTIYWLVVDPDAVFLFETVHYLNTFFVIVVSLYFVLRTFGLWAKIFNSIYLRCGGSEGN